MVMVFPSPPPAFDGTITTWLEAEAEGEVAVPLERLAALVRHFPADAEIAITADDRAATVTSGKSRFKLPVFPIADLLERHVLGEETGRVELDAKIARDLFARPAFAASTEESRLVSQRHFSAQRRRRSCRGRHRRIPALPCHDAGHDRRSRWIAR